MLKVNRIKFTITTMKCSFCKIHEAKYDSKLNWDVSGKLCEECYSYHYSHDFNSMVNRPTFRKILKLSRKKWFVGLIASLLTFSVIMRIVIQL